MGENLNSEKLLETIVKAADNKKALDIVALDMREVSGITDSFVIMEAMNNRQIDAIVDAVDNAATALGIEVGGHIEGNANSGWVLLDLGDVVVSVFEHEERLHFNLEKLWSDAPMLDLSAWVTE